MYEVEREATRVARFDVRVLITGESGVGKQTLAQLIHDHSRSAAAPIVIVDCSAVSDSVFETEWTGPVHGGRLGWLQQAAGGTLVIRSLEKMTMRKQSALFRHLDSLSGRARLDRAVVERPVRIVGCASNALLERIDNDFRADLFYRLNSVHLPVPPLRDRRGDVLKLLGGFLKDVADAQGRSTPSIAADAMRRLTAYDWPGNVRELRTVAENLAASGDPIIETGMLPYAITAARDDLRHPHGLRPVNARDDASPRPRDATRSR